LTGWRGLIANGLGRLGYSAHRWPVNRFDGMRDALLLLRAMDYVPQVVIDCGANVGQWTRAARAVFPDALMHLVEPQPACSEALESLARRIGRAQVHAIAVTAPGVDRVRMCGTGTGVSITLATAQGPDVVECPATTLDALFPGSVAATDRALLKLDLEGHEMAALEGGERLLDVIEVVVAEFQLYEIDGNRLPVFGDLVRFLEGRGYALFDVACLSGRPRDRRLRMGDAVFVRSGSRLLADTAWA
jgi:FkbM family methyltransferase